VLGTAILVAPQLIEVAPPPIDRLTMEQILKQVYGEALMRINADIERQFYGRSVMEDLLPLQTPLSYKLQRTYSGKGRFINVKLRA
jgi:hypothetical protein